MAESPAIRAIRRWRALPREERRDLFAAAWRLVVAHAVLRLAGLKRAQRLLGRPPSGAPGRGGGRDTTAWTRRGRAIRRVAARLPGAHCLARALCLWAWMRRAGLSPELKIGIRPSGDGRVLSHAWVTLDGAPVDETPEAIADCRPVDWPAPPFGK